MLVVCGWIICRMFTEIIFQLRGISPDIYTDLARHIFWFYDLAHPTLSRNGQENHDDNWLFVQIR
jgi:hypothetical protein